MSNAGGHPERAFRSLQYRDFRLIWVAEVISVTGTFTQRAALGWQIFKLTGSEFDLGLLGLVKFLPVLLFGIAGGVVADRGDRRRTLLISQSALLATAASLAILTFTGAINLWLIYLLAFIDGTVFSIAHPTRQALIPLLVPRHALAGAATMGNLGFNVAAVSGPALGGLLIAAFGPGAAYLFDATSFAIVLVSIMLIRTPIHRLPATTTGLQAARDGLAFLRRTPSLSGVMLTDAFATFFGFTSVLMPVFAEDVFGVGAGGFGLLLAAPAAGAVAMSVIMSAARLPNRVGVTVLVSVVFYGLAMFGFGLTSSFPLALACLALSGVADSLSVTCRHTMRQLITPDEMRGRMAAIHRSLGVGGPQLGEFRAGVVASVIGVGPAVAIGGVLAAATALVVGWRMPEVVRYRLFEPGERVEPESAGAPAD